MKKYIPKLIIHGGAGNLISPSKRLLNISRSLRKITADTYAVLCSSCSREAVLHGVRMLEDDPIYNAGTGSKLQRDGVARMSAAIMDSDRLVFSGVINVENIRNPIDLANRLSDEKYKVLTAHFATRFAHEHGFPFYNPVTEARKAEFNKRIRGETGTVGVVALDENGMICAGISTGGIGMELEGRVSDSPTTAGNYVSGAAGVSVTGIGEDIINLSVASRIVSCVDANIPLPDAISKTLDLAKKRNAQFGIIAIDKKGNIEFGKTTKFLFYSKHDGISLTLFDHDI